jgi:flagellar basal body-associated protein FliL
MSEQALAMKSLKITAVVLAVLAVVGLAARYGGNFKLSTLSATAQPVGAGGTGLADVGPVVRLDPFVVSELAGEDEHTSTVTFEVEVRDASAQSVFKSHTSEIRSVILTVLADTKLNEIGDPEGFATLKQRVQQRVQSILPEHVVRRVLITEFLSL